MYPSHTSLPLLLVPALPLLPPQDYPSSWQASVVLCLVMLPFSPVHPPSYHTSSSGIHFRHSVISQSKCLLFHLSSFKQTQSMNRAIPISSCAHLTHVPPPSSSRLRFQLASGSAGTHRMMYLKGVALRHACPDQVVSWKWAALSPSSKYVLSTLASWLRSS